MKRTTPEAVTASAFGQFITFVEANKLRAEVLRRLNKRLSKPARASDVHRWLHPEVWQRTEPRWGMGALLLAVWEEILRDLVEQRMEEGWKWVKNREDWRLLPPHRHPLESRATEWIALPNSSGNFLPHWIATEP